MTCLDIVWSCSWGPAKTAHELTRQPGLEPNRHLQHGTGACVGGEGRQIRLSGVTGEHTREPADLLRQITRTRSKVLVQLYLEPNRHLQQLGEVREWAGGWVGG